MVYGFDMRTWTLNGEMIRQWEATEMRISWRDRVTNVEVLRRAQVSRERKKEPKNLVLTGFVEEKRV